ncbi:MAG: PIN-like domain-containing protein [Armatimonadota bacterium]|nr:PIN-like domain-containing protein [Armatimonadota bacterium]
MKEQFHGYYRPTEEEFAETWRHALVALDANVLLSFYRYRRDTVRELLSILRELADRVWLPHQAGLEYHQNRPHVIMQEVKQCREALNTISDSQEHLDVLVDGFIRPTTRELIDGVQNLGAILEQLRELLGADEDEDPAVRLLTEDHVRRELTELFDGRVGPPYAPEQYEQKCKDASARYDKQIPPGYEDKDRLAPILFN